MSEIDWVELLVQGDVEGLWNGMHKLITHHPALRPRHSATDRAACQHEGDADLTQELFLELLQQQRFARYINQGYTSAEIESELVYIAMFHRIGRRLDEREPIFNTA